MINDKGDAAYAGATEEFRRPGADSGFAGTGFAASR